jgi:hypothetical protein
MDNQISFRYYLKPGENKTIRDITESVGVFNEEEVNIAEELAIDNINKPWATL